MKSCFVVIALAALVFSGCRDSSRAAPTTASPLASSPSPPPATSLDAGHEVFASPVQTAPLGDAAASFVAWSDPEGVAALLRGQRMTTERDDPRACDFAVPEQSCVPGSEAVEWSCKEDCARTCNECDATCRDVMKTCRAACASGDSSACDHACGVRAGACVQQCLGAKDRCFTGDCAKQLADYSEMIRSNYGCKSKRDVLQICKQTGACISKCPSDANGTPGALAARDRCVKACNKKFADGCNDWVISNADGNNCMPFEGP